MDKFNQAVLRFALEHTDGPALSQSELPERDPQDYQWLKEALDLGETDAERMKKMLLFLNGEIKNPFKGEKLTQFQETEETKKITQNPNQKEITQNQNENPNQKEIIQNQNENANQKETIQNQNENPNQKEISQNQMEIAETPKQNKESGQMQIMATQTNTNESPLQLSMMGTESLPSSTIKFTPSPQQVAFVFEEIQYLCEDLDNSNDFLKMDGIDQTMKYIVHSEEECRYWASFVLATLVQNNPKGQLALIEKGFISKLIGLYPLETSSRVVAKFLTILSSIVQTGPEVVTLFADSKGLEMLFHVLATPDPADPAPSHYSTKMKAVWVLRSMILTNQDALKKEKYHSALKQLIKEIIRYRSDPQNKHPDLQEKVHEVLNLILKNKFPADMTQGLL